MNGQHLIRRGVGIGGCTQLPWQGVYTHQYRYGHLSVITAVINGIIYSINGVFLVLITGISGHNCTDQKWCPLEIAILVLE